MIHNNEAFDYAHPHSVLPQGLKGCVSFIFKSHMMMVHSEELPPQPNSPHPHSFCSAARRDRKECHVPGHVSPPMKRHGQEI